MARVGPFDVLPRAIKKHLRVPYYFVAIWLAVLGLLYVNLHVRGRVPEPPSSPFAALVETQAQESPAGAAGEAVRQLGVSGDLSLQLAVDSEGTVTASGSGLDGLSLVGSPEEELRFRDASGKTRFRLKLKDGVDKGKLYDAEGTVLYRVKTDDAENKLKIRRPDNRDLFRVKVKDDKFNVLNAAGVRILKGKVKNGQIVVRTDPGEKTVLRIDGARDLDEASFFAIPIEAPFRILLWRAFASP
ncbi:MAG: hypothetical protein HZB55_14650 [Deltaproteobacteria bacterium]|nr:hypothetical protein [Deltaproteobacteria bacterium]